MIFLFVNYFRAANKINMYNFIVAIFKKTNYINERYLVFYFTLKSLLKKNSTNFQ
jgi:hypothetical protein